MAFKNIEDRRAWFNERRKKTKKKIDKVKKNIGKCSICGWNKHWEILQFHHRDKSKKEFKFSAGNFANYKFERLLKEIDKCDLICPNCHYWIHFNEKEWFMEQNMRYNKRRS